MNVMVELVATMLDAVAHVTARSDDVSATLNATVNEEHVSTEYGML